jgi:hypothetical protein
MKWSLSECSVAGAMRSMEGASPYARAQPVIVGVDVSGTHLIVDRYPAPTEVEGEAVTAEDWHSLTSSDEALTLPNWSAVHGCFVWLLRASYSDHTEALIQLKELGALRERTIIADTEVWLVDETRGRPARIRWATEAFDRSWVRAKLGQWREALIEAELAFSLEGSSPERLALLCVLYDRAGRKVRSEGILCSAMKSDRALGHAVGENVRSYAEELVLPRST